MKEFGEYLRNERLARGITLEEIERKTRIRRQHLIDIESGDFKRLPEPAYVKAFLKHYANCVGLDPKAVVEQYERLQGISAVHEVAATSLDGRSERRIRQLQARRRRRVGQWVGVVMVILVIVSLQYADQLFSWIGSESEPTVTIGESDAVPDDSPVEPDVAVESSALESMPEDVFHQALQSGTDHSGAEGTAHDPITQPASPALQSAGGSSEMPSVNLATDPVWVPAASDGPHFILELAANETSWAELHIDGERVLYRNLEPGEQQAYEVSREAFLRLGRAGDVHLRLNGVEVGPIGTGVVSKRFLLEGIGM